MTETRGYAYSAPGTLRRPGPVGRTVRLLLGVACALPVFSILTQAESFLSGRALAVPTMWVLSLLALGVFPEVVNIGFTRSWSRAGLRLAVLVFAGLAAVVGWLLAGSALSPPLGALTTIWFLYVYGHLGVSFILAAALGTPGCEMRAIPDLVGRITRRSTPEHYCPGFLTPLDKWETKTRGA